LENKRQIILSKFKKFFKKRKILVLIILLFIILLPALLILRINSSAREMEKYTEITFVSPNQAIIFWRSDEESLGYIKYGEEKRKRNETELQTSSDESLIHVVFIENIPPEGIFISKHTEKDSFFLIPEIQHVQYDVNEEVFNE
jgi:hypothetical protein